jgi:hypothetical protein
MAFSRKTLNFDHPIVLIPGTPRRGIAAKTWEIRSESVDATFSISGLYAETLPWRPPSPRSPDQQP